jgi:dTMP kinase
MIVALEGIDGAGKTAVAAELARVLAGAAGHVEHWAKSDLDLFEDARLRDRMAGLRELIWDPDEPEDALLETRHYLFLLAAWFQALERSRLGHQRNGDGIAIVDGWYHRVVAKAVIRGGLAEEWVSSLFTSAPRPDAVVLLDVDPQTAWERKQAFKPSELGLWDGFDGERRQAFTDYQGVVRAHLLEQARRHGWTVVPATSSSVSEVAEAARREVLRRLPVPAAR